MRFFKGIQSKGEDGRSRWALMASFDIPDKKGGYYLRRLRIVETPLFGVYLHEMRGPDPGRDLHDHPWDFVSVVLKGGYREELPIRQRSRGLGGIIKWNGMYWLSGSVHYMKATDFHTIILLQKAPTYTLIFRGRRKRVWGFQKPNGWVPWHEYEGTQLDSL